MNIERKSQQVHVYGRSGFGKTSYAERFLLGSHFDRIFIYDHQSEFWHRLGVTPITDMEDLRERVCKERILCFDYSFAYYGELEERFDEFCDEVFDICKGSLEPQGVESIFVCDELQKVVGPHNCPKPLKNIVQTGRKFAIDSLFIGQQPNEIHNTVRNQATEFILFAQKDENALKFAEMNGFDTDEVRQLQPLHYVWQNMNTSEFRRGSIDYPTKR